MALRKVTVTVLVPAHLEFPYDMLRYCECWPVSGTSASELSLPRWEADRKIALCKYTDRPHRTHWSEIWTVARWNSFGIHLQKDGEWL